MGERVESNSPTHGVKNVKKAQTFWLRTLFHPCLVDVNLLSDRIHRLLSRGLHGTCMDGQKFFISEM